MNLKKMNKHLLWPAITDVYVLHRSLVTLAPNSENTANWANKLTAARSYSQQVIWATGRI